MEGLDSKKDRSRVSETSEGDDKRRQRSSKSKRDHGNREDDEGSDGSRRKKGSALEKLSSWYEDGEHENRREGGDLRKSTSMFSDKDMDYNRSRDRDRDTVYLEKDKTYQEKDRVSSEQGRSHRKRWEDTDVLKNAEETNYVDDLDMRRRKFRDIKYESAGEISMLEHEDSLGGNLDMKSRGRVGERIDSENRTSSRDRLEASEEDNKGHPLMIEERASRGQIEQNRSSVNRDDVETRERTFNSSEDRNRKEPDYSDRSKSPVRTVKGHHDTANFEMEHERGIVSKRNEPEKEGYRDEWSKARDHEREWEVGHRHERPPGRYGGRRDMAAKTSSMYGVSDVIEIQTRPFDRKSEPPQQSETKLSPNDDLSRMRYSNENDQKFRDKNDFQDGKMKGQRNNTIPNRNVSVEPGSPFNRGASQGSRDGRGGRGWPSGRERDSQQPYGVPMPMMGLPFGTIGMAPPGPMQPLNPSGPPMSPNVFMPTFPPPLVWPGARGLDMNLLAVPSSLSPIPPRFPSNLGNPPNHTLFFNQTGLGRGESPHISSPGVNAMVPLGRGQNQDKGSGYEFPSRTIRPPGKAPSRGEQNDYSQNFVDTGTRPQNFIRELELTAVVEDYPKLRELIQKKDEIVANSATAPMYYKCDLREHVLSPEFFGTKFDVILVDPPWEEYVHRAPGVTDHMEYWTFEEIMNLKIEAIADTPCFIFLWVGDGVGLEQGRQCLKKWGFRRCEDICWVKTNKTNATPGLRHDSHTLFQRSKEHCLMGIKGTVRRSTDGHVIHANIDTDVIIAEEPPYGSTAKPEDMYRIVEHFALGRRRLELFGEDHNIRSGWLTVGKGLSSSNFNAEGYVKNFTDKDGKVWQGGGGRNPPPEAPHLVVTTPDIEALRPKSPMKNQMQMQQQSNSISVTTVNNTPNRISTVNQEASSSSFSTPGPWANREPFKGGGIGNDDRNFDMYGYNMNSGQSYEEYREFESRRAMNLL